MIDMERRTEDSRATRVTRAAWIEPNHSRRGEAEAFIADRYHRAFGAALTRFFPHLLIFEDAHGRIQAALGLRLAASQPLFLETYLDHAIEVEIGRRTGTQPGRQRIVEIGNLAANQPGAARDVIRSMTRLLQGADVRYVCFVATLPLRNAFRRLGLHPQGMAAADPGRLGDARSDWGSYYQHAPEVCFGDLESVAPNAFEAAEPALLIAPCGATRT